MKAGVKRPPPPPPARPSKALTSSPAPVDLSSALLRPVPTPRSPRPPSPIIPQASASTRHKLPPGPIYPSDTKIKPHVPHRHAKSDSSFLRPSQTQSTDNITDTNVRTLSPFSDDDPAAPPTHPSRRKQLHHHQPSSESSITSSESDLGASPRPSLPSRFRPGTSPNTSPVPPPLPTRRMTSTSSEDAAASSPRLPFRPHVVIPPHVHSLDSSTSVSPKSIDRKPLGSGRLPPPPTRTIGPGDKLPAPRRPPTPEYSDEESGEEGEAVVLPDRSRTSRRPPMMSFQYANVAPNIHVHTHASLLVSGTAVVVAHGSHINIYDLSVSDIPTLSLEMKNIAGKEYKILSTEFRPSAQRADRGFQMWIGTKEGHLLEMDIRTGIILATKYSAHPHPITHIFRHGRGMITLDDSGKCLIWSPDGAGGDDISLTQTVARIVRVVEHPSFVKIIAGRLWTATRSDTQYLPGTPLKIPVLRVYDIFKAGCPSRAVVPLEHVGAVTGATLVSGRPGLVYVGHEAGAVSIWSLDKEDGYPVCVEVTKISSSDVMCLEGVNDNRLWAGDRGGMISAYDVSQKPWVITNSWVAHPGLPVMRMVVDHYGIDKIGRLCVVSTGRDEQLRLWDGLLGLDWVDEELLKYEDTFTTTRPLKMLVVSWNCDAARPDSLTGEPANVNFLFDALHSVDAPDIVSFGFQEVIDLENHKMTAKNILTTKDKNDDGLSERVTGAYRRWNDRLIMAMRQAMPPDVTYSVVHTHSLIGLFSCIFIKNSERERGTLRDASITHVKTGLRGRYALIPWHCTQGGIISRFVLDDSSFCLINCHLAAGQNAVRQRNDDITTILEGRTVFTETPFPLAYVGGGDGMMVLDHEIVIVSGDLNYRIDHRREAITSAVHYKDFSNLLVHDQLHREIKTNRACRLRDFSEGPLRFAPTYKYDPHSNDYDTSEKRRSPAWCDRILWRSRVESRVSQLHYRRYEVDVSDHRPISSAFTITVKSLKHEARQKVKGAVQAAWVDEQNRLLLEAKKFYVKQSLI
ncbi:hypothetical protein C0991_003020 [Blastosporella zonata]|nr:hypothetical protein C0991_003020 [Blastosporella zonata]